MQGDISTIANVMLFSFLTQTLKELKLEPMAEKETIVEMDNNLTIYHVEPEDAGVYQCQVGDSHGSLLVLEVVDIEESYTIVSSDKLTNVQTNNKKIEPS